MSGSEAFLERFIALYSDSFLANVAVGVLLGALGLFVVLRRVVFLSAALSQVAGAGLALAFFIGAVVAHRAPVPVHPGPQTPAAAEEHLDHHKPEDSKDAEIAKFLGEGEGATSVAKSSKSHLEKQHAKSKPAAPPPKLAPPGAEHHRHHEPFSPLLVSILITVIVSLLLSMRKGGWRSTQESIVGLVFILSAGASIIMAQLAEKGAHEITQLLFGTAIFIPPDQQILVYVMAAVGLLAYVVLFKDFVFVSFDPVAARAGRFPVGLTNGVLFSILAIAITVCTRAVGAMPVFALTVLPPAAALQLHDRIGPAALTSALLGGLSAASGYFLSGLLNLSAGPLITLNGAIIFVLAWGVRRVLSARAPRAAS